MALNKEQAKAAIAEFKANPAAAVAVSLQPVPQIGTLPVNLSDAHAAHESMTVKLSEANNTIAKVVVSGVLASDAVKIAGLVREGRITPAVAVMLSEYMDGLRTNQLIQLSDGMGDEAASTDANAQALMSIMGQLPAQGAASTTADPNAPAAGVPTPDANPAAGADAGNSDDQLDAAAQELMKQTPGLSYVDALKQAADQLGIDSTSTPNGPPAGAAGVN